jgi:hypothetical protein
LFENGVITYAVMGEPLSDEGADQVTVAFFPPAFAVKLVGAVGTPAIVLFSEYCVITWPLDNSRL